MEIAVHATEVARHRLREGEGIGDPVVRARLGTVAHRVRDHAGGVGLDVVECHLCDQAVEDFGSRGRVENEGRRSRVIGRGRRLGGPREAGDHGDREHERGAEARNEAGTHDASFRAKRRTGRGPQEGSPFGRGEAIEGWLRGSESRVRRLTPE